MRRSTLAIAVVLGVFLGGVGRPLRARADGAERPKEGLRDPFLQNLSGKWDLERRIRGREERNAVDAEWVLGHQFLRLHMIDAARPPAYEALVMIGYDDGAQRYVAQWCDTWGGKFSAIGYGKRSGNSIEFRFEFSDGPFYNTFTWHPEIRGWDCRLENVDKEGKRVLFAEDSLRRP
jgi:hypothetical protein